MTTRGRVLLTTQESSSDCPDSDDEKGSTVQVRVPQGKGPGSTVTTGQRIESGGTMQTVEMPEGVEVHDLRGRRPLRRSRRNRFSDEANLLPLDARLKTRGDEERLVPLALGLQVGLLELTVQLQSERQ